MTIATAPQARVRDSWAIDDERRTTVARFAGAAAVGLAAMAIADVLRQHRVVALLVAVALQQLLEPYLVAIIQQLIP